MADTNNTMDMAALLAQIEALKAQNEALAAKASQPRALTLKVSEKGALSIYGLGRFPITVYRSQAERLFTAENVERVQKFIVENSDKLVTKA